jgi:hypothetical protein
MSETETSAGFIESAGNERTGNPYTDCPGPARPCSGRRHNLITAMYRRM